MPKKKPKPNGRPRKPIDPERVEELCKAQLTKEELAGALHISIATLNRRIRDEPELAEAVINGWAGGKAELKELQFKAARNLDPSMLKWLGGVYLGQTNKVEVSGSIETRVKFVDPGEVSEDEWATAFGGKASGEEDD